MAATATSSAELRVLATLAVKGAMPALEDSFVKAGGPHLAVTYAPTQGLLEAIGSGARGDVAIVTRDGALRLAASRVLGSAIDFADSYVGAAVRTGAPKPDVSTRAALIDTLHKARSIAYSRIGASGLYFARLIESLGVAEMVNAKAIVVPGGFTAAEVASGRVELAIQQVSELLVVPGVEVAGTLPKDLQTPTRFSAAVFQEARAADTSARLVAYLASPAARPLLAASGLEPIG